MQALLLISGELSEIISEKWKNQYFSFTVLLLGQSTGQDAEAESTSPTTSLTPKSTGPTHRPGGTELAFVFIKAPFDHPRCGL